MALTRRRFLAITAAAATVAGPARAAPIHQWRGIALGADASITLAHDDAEAIIARALHEIARLESIFSLHDPDSALVRLNAAARLDQPPFELLECLGLAGAVHAATGGRFDPTIQPLWALYAEHHAAGRSPGPDAIAATLDLTGWQHLRLDAAAITMRPGMALSLNGIAQGLIADKVADMLRAEGLRDVLVNTGEFHAIGGHPQGGDWPITLDDGQMLHQGVAHLQDGALASSAPLGTTFDGAGQVGHILDPATGTPAQSGWRLITVTAPRAALADALSTAFCLMDREAIDATLAQFTGARLVYAA